MDLGTTMTTTQIGPPVGTPVVHTPGEDTLGGCLPRIWATCRTCGEYVVLCHASNADIRAIMRRGWRHAACETAL